MKTKAQLLNLLKQLKSQVFIVEDQLKFGNNEHGDEDPVEDRVKNRLFKLRIELGSIEKMVNQHG